MSRRWTEPELEILRRRYPVDDVKSIAADLGRGIAGVADKAHQLGLRKPGHAPWTAAELDEIRRRYADEPAADIARDLGRSTSMIYHHAGKLGLKKSAEFLKRMADNARPWVDWTDNEIRALRRRYPHEKTERIAKDLQRTVKACYGMAKKLGLKKTAEFMQSPDAGGIRPGERRGRKYEFRKGHVPANKGLRRPGWAPGRMAETQFKPGQRPQRWVPVGTEVTDPDGYLKRKIRDDAPPGMSRHNWRFVHVLIWEQANGPVPAGHAIAFKDGNKQNLQLDNLECISRPELMRRNTIHNYPAPVVDAIRAKGVLTREINKQRGRHGKGRPERADQKDDRRSS